jgi:hypothetical protein
MLLASRANDDRAAANRASIQAGFTIRARELGEILAGENVPGARTRAIAMIDPASRRRAWVRPLWIDGRRTPAPYADYIDFLRALGNGRRGAR